VPLDAAAEALATLRPAPGRLNPLPGENGSLLLDDTYNASPAAVRAALDTLAELPATRRIAVLGDMLELGPAEAELHRAVGQRAAEVVDLLITRGEKARGIAEGATAGGLPPDRIAVVYTATDALARLRGQLGAGDVVLLKGSAARAWRRSRRDCWPSRRTRHASSCGRARHGSRCGWCGWAAPPGWRWTSRPSPTMCAASWRWWGRMWR